MNDTLRQCEREVEQARSKLTHDLGTLRAPETFSSFTDDVKRDAMEIKDSVIDQAKHAAQSKLTDFVEDLKARAAANPAAALAIGAGIAWRLLRHPPIATALIGAGLYSLLRTNGFQPHDGSRPDYFQHGKQRLKEQAGALASDLASGAKGVAADVGEAVSAKTAEMIDTAKTKTQQWSETAQTAAQGWSKAAQIKAQEWSDDVGQGAAAVGSALKAETESLNAATRNAVRNVADTARGVGAHASARTAQVVREAMHDGRDALTDLESRDKLLLGVAGVAVAAALGIACQRRIAEQVD